MSSFSADLSQQVLSPQVPPMRACTGKCGGVKERLCLCRAPTRTAGTSLRTSLGAKSRRRSVITTLSAAGCRVPATLCGMMPRPRWSALPWRLSEFRIPDGIGVCGTRLGISTPWWVSCWKYIQVSRPARHLNGWDSVTMILCYVPLPVMVSQTEKTGLGTLCVALTLPLSRARLELGTLLHFIQLSECHMLTELGGCARHCYI